MIKASLPIAFDTPMFWSSEDLEQLKGTAVLGRSIRHMGNIERTNVTLYIDKIGKEQAENDYSNKVVPLLRVRALFIKQVKFVVG
jgi:SET domain-containing protein 6